MSMTSMCGTRNNMVKHQNSLSKDFTASPDKYPQKRFNPKPCRWCSNIFLPTGPSHHYCSDNCRKFVYADKHYKRVYGIGIMWVLQKLDEQNYKCAICKTSGFKMKDEHISGMNLDHCHVTGNPRALLCHNCNRGLGLFQDNPAYLRQAAEYLEEEYEPARYEKFKPGKAERIIQRIKQSEEESQDDNL